MNNVDRQAIYDHMLQCRGPHWMGFKHHTKPLTLKEGAHCYSHIWSLEPKDFEHLAVGYYCKKDDPIGIKYLNWVTSEKKSPWRSLIKDSVEMIEDKTSFHGFFVGRKTLNECTSWRYLVSFLIATRAFNEFPEHIQAWGEMVDEGIPEERAFIYCRNVSLYDSKFRLSLVPNTNHWPICQDVDFERFRDSKPDLNSDKTNWMFSTGYKETGNYGMYYDQGVEAPEEITRLAASGHITRENLLRADKELSNKYRV